MTVMSDVIEAFGYEFNVHFDRRREEINLDTLKLPLSLPDRFALIGWYPQGRVYLAEDEATGLRFVVNHHVLREIDQAKEANTVKAIGLTDAERDVLTRLGNAYGAYLNLPRQHLYQRDEDDFAYAIRQVQNIIFARVAMRLQDAADAEEQVQR